MTGAGGTLLLGVRHHGPGSARAVRAALDEARPGVVLVEGPPEADPLVRLAGDEGMRPPVALLAHVVDEPGRSAFWPLAEFSPEWVAIRWAVERDAPVRFIDLPAAHSLARTEKPAESDESDESDEPDVPEGGDVPEEGEDAVRIDPIAVLAETAGYDDPERWWEDVVEHREAGGDAFAPFEAVSDAMEALREVYGDGGHSRDLVREAHMRLQMRAAQKEFGPDRVAVVCGAWHVPALRRKATVAADRALLKGLPKVKAEMTWVPWTHRRLSRASGYGAGIASPGWYGHLFAAADRPLERWMTKVAGLLRDEDRLVSSAHVIEAVRLAEALAAMRGRPLAGLSETTDAVRAVMCEGSDVPLALVHDRLVVGDVLGEVPESAPAVPLQRDLTRAQRRLRLKPEALEREVELDLRKETDAARSRLLHRLRLLGVDWGRPERSRGSTGTFRETWRLRWEPELSVRVAEAGVWGTTVLGAATGKASADAVGAVGLADVTALAERCLLAELPEALPVVMRVLADRAALDADVGHLAQALPALVRSLRYGDVRGTDTGALGEVALGLAERVFVGLPGACVGLGTDAALEMRGHVDAVHQAVGLLGEFRGGSAERGRERDVAAGAPAAPGGIPVDGARGGGRVAPGGEGAGGVRADGARGGGSAASGGEGSGGMPADGARGGARVVPGGEGLHGLPAGGARGEGAAASGGEGPHGIGADDGRGGGSAAPGGEGPHGIPVDGAQGRGAAVPGRGRVHGMRVRWGSVLRVIARRDTAAGVVRGRCVRLLLDGGELAGDEVARLMGLALSRGSEPAEAAAWIEGFVGGGAGGGMLLVHDERLLGLVDDWLSGLSDDAFIDVLPLLRRTFSAYEPGVRRTLGELVRRGAPGAGPVVGGGGVPGFGEGMDAARADAAVPTVRLLLGMAQRENDDTVGVAG
ncbi:DUF5682 family protein [Streptomyces sp. NPDC018584]|uniref:DUF5682 family protein n=1 Tax=unclassified Streptomyces TaxID=2593676 RepID=UPI003798B71A